MDKIKAEALIKINKNMADNKITMEKVMIDKVDVDKLKADKMKARNGKIDTGKQQRNSLAQQVKDLKLEPTSSVPMRRKAKDNNLDHSTFSLSRLDSKRSSKSGQDYFLVE